LGADRVRAHRGSREGRGGHHAGDHDRGGEGGAAPSRAVLVGSSAMALTRPWPTFSLLFFASQPAEVRRREFDPARESRRFAARHGFEAVWVPERHFHAFGGMFPNPGLFGVVLAETTTRVRIRAGSVVMPLPHPIRVAEEWSVVDNLSEGRVDISFAIGWNPTDFVLAPGAYADRPRRALDGIDGGRRPWGGDEPEEA